jgi:hypothetical protein
MDFSDRLVKFRGSRVIPGAVIAWMLDVQARGGRFHGDGGDWRVTPRGTLTIADLRFVLDRRRWAQIAIAIECFERWCFHD